MTRMLVTRPEPDAGMTAMRLRALDIEPVTAPLLHRASISTSALPGPNGYAGIVLTSANGLRALADRGKVEPYRHLPVYAVGSHTAREAEGHGFGRVFDADGAFPDLVEMLVRAKPRGPLLHLTGRHRTGDLARSVGEHGVRVETIELYDMVAATELPEAVIAEMVSGQIAAALFYSRRTAETFVNCLGTRLSALERDAIEMLCMSETVAEPLLAAHFVRVSLADHPDDGAMMSLALAFAREQNRA